MKKRIIAAILSAVMILNNIMPVAYAENTVASSSSAPAVETSVPAESTEPETAEQTADIPAVPTEDTEVKPVVTDMPTEVVEYDYSCKYCGLENGHTTECKAYIPQVNYGATVPGFEDVGPLLSGIADKNTQVTLFTTNENTYFSLLRAGREDAGRESDDTLEFNGNKTEITSPDGNVKGTKEVLETGEKDDYDNPVFSINLTAYTESLTVGESCDFVLVLDMSYSMSKGDNLRQLKEACKRFVKDLAKKSPYSRIAIVTYGGDRNANKYYIAPFKNTENGTNAVMSMDDDGRVYLYEKGGKVAEAQQWYISHTKDGYVNIVNVKTGMALEATNGTVTAGQSTIIHGAVIDESYPAKQHFKMNSLVAANNVYQFLSRLKDGNTPFNLDYVNGQTHNDNGVILWNHTAATVSNPQRWYVTRVSTDVDYETYYWTDTGSETGYNQRTAEDDPDAADNALLLVSQNEGKEINEKLIKAIDELKVYGGRFEGSHPGEAMEKATRILQNVRENDTNDYCARTGEKYYFAKRGVLYFADGAPAPSDSTQLNSYPSGNTDALRQYGYEYDFENTYNDVQDALNWGKVLKYTKGENIPSTVNGYNSNGEPVANQDPFNMFYINEEASLHEYKEYYDEGGTTVTGCGATVYVLSINLVTIDVTIPRDGTCTIRTHKIYKDATKTFEYTSTHIYKEVEDESGNKKKICINAVNDHNFFFDSFDSRSNEYFYRLSSHRKDSSHVSFGNPNVGAPDGRTNAQETWHKAFTGTFTNKNHGWSGRYPDFLCRNQESSYFVACENTSTLVDVFSKIAVQTAKDLDNLTLMDNITQYFNVCDKYGNPAQEGDYIKPDGTVIKPDAVDGQINIESDVYGIITVNATGNFAVVWRNIDLHPGTPNENNELVGQQKLDSVFYVVSKPEFLGGKHVPSNDGATLLDPEDKPIIKYPDPDVEVPVKPLDSVDVEMDTKSGAAYNEHVTKEQLEELISINAVITNAENPDESIKLPIDLTAPNYGLENWQVDHINIDFEIYHQDEDGNYVPIEENEEIKIQDSESQFIARVWIWSKYDEKGNEVLTPPEGRKYVECEIEIIMHYPTFIFADRTQYYGEELLTFTSTFGKPIDGKYISWYTREQYARLQDVDPTVEVFEEDENGEYKGYDPLPSANTGDVNYVSDTPDVYFMVDPIDERVPVLTGSEEDGVTFIKTHLKDPYTEKYSKYMGKDPVAMNVRIYYANKEDTNFEENAQRDAFFLHADCIEESCDHLGCDIATHFSAGKILLGIVDGKEIYSNTSWGEYWLPEFYINPKFCTITIEKQGGRDGETYVFDIYKQTVDTETPTMEYYTSASVTGNGSITINELPIGTYEIRERKTWSWRDIDSIKWGYEGTADTTGNTFTLKANADEDDVKVVVTNSRDIKTWLNGYSKVLANTFSKSNQ